MLQRKRVYVNVNNPRWREWRGALVKKGRLYGRPLEVTGNEFVVLWDDSTISTEEKSKYELVFGD